MLRLLQIPTNPPPLAEANLASRSIPMIGSVVSRFCAISRPHGKAKQFRRVAIRYDKLLVNFTGFVKLAAVAIWLR
jgi:transposase